MKSIQFQMVHKAIIILSGNFKFAKVTWTPKSAYSYQFVEEMNDHGNLHVV